MSFDVFFQPCRFGCITEGEQSNEPLTAVEEQAVRNLLAHACPSGPDEHHCWVVQVGDGGSAEVFGKDLSAACMFALHDFTPDLVQLMFDLLVAGNWVMLPAQDGPGAIAASVDALRGVPDGFPEVAICGSADALGVLLGGGSQKPNPKR
jgi:hypothetical protein